MVIAREEHCIKDFINALDRLDCLPKITGSECDCFIFHNTLKESYEYLLLAEKQHMTQPQKVKVVLSFYGDLRDKTVKDTEKEFVRLVCRLRNRKWQIEEMNVTMNDNECKQGYGEEVLDRMHRGMFL